MDYEKAYKAVLQTAKQWIKDGCTDKEKICLECVFPELRESEDERIRKEIIKYIFFETGDRLSTEEQKRWIAYLEKQEQKPAEYGESERIRKKLIETIGYFRSRGIDQQLCEEFLAYLKKQEQNVIVYDGDNYKSAKEKAWNNFYGKASLIPEAKSIHDNGFRGGYQFGIHEEKPLKWTVHDEAVRKEAIACLEEWKRLIPCSSIEDYNNILNWLKEELSIHTEKQEQKPDVELIQRSWYMEGYHDREFGKEPMWLITACDDGPRYEPNPKYGKKLVDEQKPVLAHDENGDAILSDFEAALFSAFSDAWQTYLNGENVNVVEWAKEHAPELIRVAGKPDWSEEDEKRIKQLIYDTEHIRAEYEKRKDELGEYFNDKLIKDCDEQIAWLKDLRPSWKPSKEQIEALKDAKIRMSLDGWGLCPLLQSLINDLESL